MSFFVALEARDTIPNLAHMGFKNTNACAELVQVVRLRVGKRAEWRTYLAQGDLARACGSILHFAILRAMQKRSVFEHLGMAYIREARRAIVTFEHAYWPMRPMKEGVGLAQG